MWAQTWIDWWKVGRQAGFGLSIGSLLGKASGPTCAHAVYGTIVYCTSFKALRVCVCEEAQVIVSAHTNKPLHAHPSLGLTLLLSCVAVAAVCCCCAGQPALLVVVLNTFRYTRYLLLPERNAIHVVLHAEAQPRDMVQAYLQVMMCLCVCEQASNRDAGLPRVCRGHAV